MLLSLSIINVTVLNLNALIDVKNNSIFWTHGLNNNVRVIKCKEEKKCFKECKKKIKFTF